MYKRIFAVLVAATMLFCSSCSSDTSSDISSDVQSSIPSQNENSSREKPIGGGGGLLAPFTITEYSEYADFIDSYSHNLPENFVAYDEISYLGEFVEFTNGIHFSDTDPEDVIDYGVYWYVLEDDTGAYIQLNIEANDDLHYHIYGEIPDSVSDLRYGFSDFGTCFSHHGALYIYTRKEGDSQTALNKIILENEELYCIINRWHPTEMYGHRLGDYPQDGSNEFLKRLLHRDTAKSAIDQLMDTIDDSVYSSISTSPEGLATE